jgi:hypothetical protein
VLGKRVEKSYNDLREPDVQSLSDFDPAGDTLPPEQLVQESAPS